MRERNGEEREEREQDKDRWGEGETRRFSKRHILKRYPRHFKQSI